MYPQKYLTHPVYRIEIKKLKMTDIQRLLQCCMYKNWKNIFYARDLY